MSIYIKYSKYYAKLNFLTNEQKKSLLFLDCLVDNILNLRANTHFH